LLLKPIRSTLESPYIQHHCPNSVHVLLLQS